MNKIVLDIKYHRVLLKKSSIFKLENNRSSFCIICFREFQPMTFAFDNSSLLLDQDTNKFLV